MTKSGRKVAQLPVTWFPVCRSVPWTGRGCCLSDCRCRDQMTLSGIYNTD